MQSARHPRPGSRTGTGQPTAPAAEARRFLTRGRVGFLMASEGGRSALLMVAPVRGPEHLELIRRARFYHVPVASIAASRTAVNFIAFYEGASRFRGRTGVIREYAGVLRVSRVRRCDLPGLTWPARGAPDAPYYRFDLGPMQTLPRPITNPDRIRVVFRFPAFDRLAGAVTLRDLGKPGSQQRRQKTKDCP